MKTLLEVQELTKKYGKKTAIDDLSFSLDQGKILGLLGPNGSGKTTLLKVLAGIQHPNGGSVSILGNSLGYKTKADSAFLSDVNPLFPSMKVDDAIDFYADFFADFDKVKCREILDFMKLTENYRVKAMSKGMIEKLNLSLIFSRKARLFLLDEPLGGVDPVARERIVSTIIKTYSEDSSIIISSHLVHDVENTFDEVLMIHEGKAILSGDAEELRKSHGLSIHDLFIQTFQDLL